MGLTCDNHQRLNLFQLAAQGYLDASIDPVAAGFRNVPITVVSGDRLRTFISRVSDHP
jgi:hypothetical protein